MRLAFGVRIPIPRKTVKDGATSVCSVAMKGWASPQPQKVRDRGKPNGAVLPWNFIARKLDRTGTGTQTNPQPNTSLGCFSASRPKQEFPRGARVVDPPTPAATAASQQISS